MHLVLYAIRQAKRFLASFQAAAERLAAEYGRLMDIVWSCGWTTTTAMKRYYQIIYQRKLYRFVKFHLMFVK